MKIATVNTGEFGITSVDIDNHNGWHTDLYAPGGMNHHSAFFFMLQHDVAWVIDEEAHGESVTTPVTLQDWYWNVEGGK